MLPVWTKPVNEGHKMYSIELCTECSSVVTRMVALRSCLALQAILYTGENATYLEVGRGFIVCVHVSAILCWLFWLMTSQFSVVFDVVLLHEPAFEFP